MKTTKFDASRHLVTEEDISTYLNLVLQENDTDLLISALGDLAKARGMAEVAKSCGMGRESLYKALRPGSKPRFETIAKVCGALGLDLTAQPHAALR